MAMSVNEYESTTGALTDLEDLRQASLRILLSFTACVAYAWMGYLLLADTGSMRAWYGPAVLVAGGVLSYRLAMDSIYLASYTLILAMTAATACALSFFGPGPAAYALALVVTFGGLLLSPVFALILALASMGVVWASISPSESAPPMIVILLTAVATWLSQRSLYVALQWAWTSQAEAQQKMELARDHQAALQRTAKALDEASYRIRRMNVELARAREAAEEARLLKQQFVQNVSHELRTPLNIIVGFSEMMAIAPESYGVGGLPSAFRGDINEVYRSARHLEGLIDDVLDLAQIEARRMGLMKETLDPAKLAIEAAETARSLIENRGLTLRIHVESPSREHSGLPLVCVDRTRIRQVLLNLLNNAARFTERGSVAVSASLTEGEIMISVADTGIGIALENIPKAFEEFRQLDGSTTRRYGGTGLGLAISKEFVELHGGRMWVESQLGEGSTFFFTLPLAQAEETPSAPTRLVAASPVTPFDEPFKEKTVLLVHNDPVILRLFQRHLEGYRVVGARDRAEAQWLIGEEHPRALVLGMLPDRREGGETSFQEAAFSHGIPVIACPIPGSRHLANSLGVTDYLIKPISRKRLMDAVGRWNGGLKRLLIIDDDPGMVRLLARMLRSASHAYQVDMACGGQEGLSLMAEVHPDLVLLDLMMPPPDGLEVLERMRSEEKWRHIPVIAVTAKDLIAEDTSAPQGKVLGMWKGDGFTTWEVMTGLQGLLDSLGPASI